MFPYTVKYTESKSDIQNNNVLYKIDQQCQNTFELWEKMKKIKSFNFVFSITYKLHNSYLYILYFQYILYIFVHTYIYISYSLFIHTAANIFTNTLMNTFANTFTNMSTSAPLLPRGDTRNARHHAPPVRCLYSCLSDEVFAEVFAKGVRQGVRDS